MRVQRAHLPTPNGSFAPCDDSSCQSKHQDIKVKGHGGATYILACPHGSHTIVEDDLTEESWNASEHLADVVEVHTCGCTLEQFKQEHWDKAVRWMQRENVKRTPDGKSVDKMVTQQELLSQAQKLRDQA